MMMPWQKSWAPAVSFAVLAVVGGIALNTQADTQSTRLYHSQLQTCERQNQLRAESNRRIASHEVETQVLRDFLTAGHEARKAAWSRYHQVTDREAAEEYARLLRVLDSKVIFSPVSIINCKKVIAKP